MFSNYHEEQQKNQAKSTFGNNFSNRNLYKNQQNAQSSAGQTIVGLSQNLQQNSNGPLLIGGQNMQVHAKPKMVRGPNPLVPSKNQAPLYDPSHRFNTAYEASRKNSQAPPARNAPVLNSRTDRYNNNTAVPTQPSMSTGLSAQRSRSKNMATALNQRQPNPFESNEAGTPSNNLGRGIGGAAFRAGSNKNEPYVSHYRRSDATAGPPSETLSTITAHRGQNAPRPPAHLPKQRGLYQDFAEGQNMNKSHSNVKNTQMLNQYSSEIGPDGIPVYADVPGSSQSKKRYINNDMGNSFYAESSNGMNGRSAHYQPGRSDSNNQKRQLSREGMRKMNSTLDVHANGSAQEAPTTQSGEPFSASASPFKMSQNTDGKPPAQPMRKARANISNLPQSKLDQLRGEKGEKTRTEEDEELFQDLAAAHRGANGPATMPNRLAARAGAKPPNGAAKAKKQNPANFFAAWDENELIDLDFTTQEVLADNEAFDILAERGYETLLDYHEGGKDPKRKLQEYEMQQQNNNYVFNFENYIKRQKEEEEIERLKQEQAALGSGEDDESASYYDEEEDDEENAEEAEGDAKNPLDEKEVDGSEEANSEEEGSQSPKMVDDQDQTTEDTKEPMVVEEPQPSKKLKARRKNQKPKKGEPGYGVFAINTSYCRSELELLQHVIFKNQLRETSIGGDLYWMALALNKNDFKRVAKNKFYWNRYPFLEYLARKKVFCMITNRMRKTFEKQFGFSPISFQLPEETHSLQKYMEEHPKFTFICKPNSGKGGEGIFLIDKFKDIPKNLWSDSHSDLLVQRYIKTPILLDKKKFDLRIYVMIKGFEPIEAYLCDEGLARFCTEDYRQPNPQNMKNMFMHLTNFTLNKQSENYKAPETDFLEEGQDQGSKRLLSSLWKTLEDEGHDIQEIKDKIKDTVRKAIITMEPYLTHYYKTHVSSTNYKESKVFHILGLDILIDKKFNAWLMEVNSNPSLNIFLEREIPGALDGQTEKVLQELDKHVKAKVVTETIRIVTGECNEEYAGSFEQLLPDPSMESYYVWNKAQQLYEMMTQTQQTKKDPEMKGKISMFQFARLYKVPEFGKLGSYFKADLEIVFKQLLQKYDLQHNCLDLYSFLDALEMLSQKIYKNQEDSTFGDHIGQFLDAALPFFEEFLHQQEQEQEMNRTRQEPGFAAKRKIPDRY